MSQKPLKNPLPKIDGYLIEGVLGRGATGVVYSAVQLAVDRPVAIKVLHTQLMGSKSAVRRLQREARTAARLAHPGIISAIDMGEQDGLWWYAMELVEGISLGERVDERGPLSERDALRFFLPLVEALQHAFEAGVVHRDIKPSNILIDSHGKARLVDLGLAFAEDDPMVTKPGGTLGTPHYISPEQARDPSAADTRSDLWSLGATMYHAVCARPPFQGESVAEILSGVLYQRVPDPRLLAPELSKGFSLVLRKCLSREPGGRYQNPRELQADLERLVERRAPEIRTASLDPVDDGRPEWMQHWPWIVGGVAALAIGLVLWGPWSGDELDVEPAPAIVTWPLLELLEERYAAGGLNLAVAAGRLTELGAAPTGAEGLAAAFRNRLKLDLDGAVSALAQEFEDAVSVELRILDLVSAQAQLGKLASLLEVRTGYPAVDAFPEGPSRQVLAGTLQRLEVQFSQQRESARRRAVEELDKHLTRTLIPAVAAAREAFRWKDARALLETESEWLAQAGIESKLLPEDEQRLIEDGKARLAAVTNTLFPHYKATVDSLQSFLQADEDELREKVERGSLGAAAELSARFEAELTQRAIDRDQVPADYQTIWPFEGKLKELVEELRDYEARLLEADASEDYAVDLLHVAGLLRSRRYDAALSLWDDRLGDPWRSSVHAAIGQRRREAELLEGLLIQVAKAVRARHDKQLEITLGDIMHRAQVVATRTPEQIVEEGFEVVLPGLEQPFAITLRARAAAGDGVETLPTETLIALSGLNPKDVALDGFVVALFLHYEGRHKAAREHLPGGPFEETVLLAPLQQRIDAALDEQAETDRDRDGEKDRLLRGLQRYVRDGRSTPENMLASGELLLSSYRDLLTPEEVLEVQGICVDCRRRLRPPSAEEAFPAATIEKHFSGIVTLTWDFERTGGAWRLGDWFAWDDDGVVRMTVPRETQEDFWDRGRALRLPLGRPLAVDQELDLTMTLAWADEHGDEFDNDVVLSVAGAHLLFVDGPIGRPNRWAVTRQDPRAAFEKLRLDADPRFDGFLGFSRDEPFEVRVKLASSQGRMQVWVDGVELEMPKEPQRAAAPEQPELVLYSKYLLEASRVVLKARLRQ